MYVYIFRLICDLINYNCFDKTKLIHLKQTLDYTNCFRTADLQNMASRISVSKTNLLETINQSHTVLQNRNQSGD